MLRRRTVQFINTSMNKDKLLLAVIKYLKNSMISSLLGKCRVSAQGQHLEQASHLFNSNTWWNWAEREKAALSTTPHTVNNRKVNNFSVNKELDGPAGQALNPYCLYAQALHCGQINRFYTGRYFGPTHLTESSSWASPELTHLLPNTRQLTGF